MDPFDGLEQVFTACVLQTVVCTHRKPEIVNAFDEVLDLFGREAEGRRRRFGAGVEDGLDVDRGGRVGGCRLAVFAIVCRRVVGLGLCFDRWLVGEDGDTAVPGRRFFVGGQMDGDGRAFDDLGERQEVEDDRMPMIDLDAVSVWEDYDQPLDLQQPRLGSGALPRAVLDLTDLLGRAEHAHRIVADAHVDVGGHQLGDVMSEVVFPQPRVAGVDLDGLAADDDGDQVRGGRETDEQVPSSETSRWVGAATLFFSRNWRECQD